ncbi:hypothetical protein GP486_003227 [Trichoglossum hirsutum]|uniref:NACHT domain-containing protein n=1 Tax=Trichoglossum hirsutum TaxID=265104 RepID=A0A9P8LDJ7_9PEZI|nr:hypothetical protein GP486_003227 [Trichoglossum hirsutum]
MSGAPAPPAKPSIGERLRKRFRSRSRALSPTSASVSTQALISPAAQSPHSSYTQILASSSPSAGLVAANPPDAGAAPSSSQQAASNLSPSNDLLDDVLKRLSDGDRATLREYVLPTSNDIDLAVRQALAAAEEKQRYCIEKSWAFTYAGRKITLKEEAYKVVRWLNRFKAVGDVAVNANPVHAGLPWAGICLLLEAAVSEANQMTYLLVGCETALYMANRLTAYVEFLYGLPATVARTNFNAALVKLYTRILQFLAQAIRVYQTPALIRTFRAFWGESEIQEFEKECDQLGIHVETEASNCDRALSAQDRERTRKLKQDLQSVLREFKNSHQIQESLDRMEIKLDLDKLPYAKGAIFNSYGDNHITCHPATRVDLLRQIQDWAQQADSKSIFWLNGMAGTGKSTISRTMAEWLAAQNRLGVVDLGASFFFKRGEGDRGSASRFFSTITRQLVLKIPGLDDLIANVITSDPLIFDKALGEQFDKLLYQPLCKVNVTSHDYPVLVLVVDALDECEKESDIKIILDLWSRIPQITPIRLRLFLTSRPDLPILQGIKKLPADAHEHMVLQDAVPQTTIQDDISTFLKDEFSKIRENCEHDGPVSTALERDWPGDKVLQILTDMATPLFIVAATVCRFVGDIKWSPRTRLEKVLEMKNLGAMSQMEQTYLPVLQQLSTEVSDSRDTEALYQEFRIIVGSIVILTEPLSIASLAGLLKISPNDIWYRLRPLHSVLRVPANFETPVRTLHLSFNEFLLSDKLQCQPFGVDGPATHRILLTKCLELLSGPDGLRENLCDLAFPGQLRREINSTIIDERLSPAIQYACRYWVHHTEQSMVQIRDEDEIHIFLQRHFLHWLEALSLINRIAEVIRFIGVLQSSVSVQDSDNLLAFLEDARRFILAHRYIADLAPLQLYSSAIAFTPQTSIVKKFYSQVSVELRKCPITWGPELQKLEGHTGSVYAVAFSQDGSLLASGSRDHTVKLWNPSTGREVQTLYGHANPVKAVAFSHDGLLLASGSNDTTVRLWNPNTGQEVQTLKGHTGIVFAVTFSPEGSMLASGSKDQTVRLWNPSTGQEVQTLEGHTEPMSAMAFSQGGSLLASASEDCTVRLWNPSTGREVQTLHGHNDPVNAVAFSQDGLLLASGSNDTTVRLWNPSTGQAMQTLEGHIGIVLAVTFSQDCSLLASGSYDKTVRLWESSTGREVRTLKGHWGPVNAVAFSPGGSLLASGSGDRTIRLWNPSTGREVRTLHGHISIVYAVAFSQNGSLLTSGSYDETIRLWDPRTGQEVQSLENVVGVRTISLAIDNKTLLTNRGALSFSDESTTLLGRGPSTHTIMIKNDWIQRGNRKFLWLPQEYRSNRTAFYGSTLAIGQTSGQVSFIELDPP